MGMLLTPPDAISQTLLAVPVYLLYEAGLILAKVLGKQDDVSASADKSDSTDI